MKLKVLAMALCLVLIAGCQGNQVTTTNDENNGSEVEEINNLDAMIDMELPIVPEPVTFTFFNGFAGKPFDSEWAVWQEVEKLTNIKLEGVLDMDNTDEDAAFNYMLSSGNLADIISYRLIADLENLGRNGGILPLDELIDEHAPHIKAYFEEHPEYKKEMTAVDGQIYFIPKIDDFPVSQVYWIRKDWLDKLDLQVPTTLDELHTVLTAFKNEDPNGNGLADEVPYFDRDAHWFFDNVLYLWDASTDWYARDGQITFGPLEEEFLYGIGEATKWYEEGLIDSQIFTRGNTARDELLNNNLGGMTHDWVGSTASYNDRLPATIEGFELIPILPVQNQKGEVVNRTYRYPIVPGWAISSQCEDPVTVIKFFDFFFTEEGHRLLNFGLEGVTYNWVDGEVVYTDAVMNGDNTPLNILRSYGVQYRIGMIQDFEYERAWASTLANETYELYENAGIISNPVPSISGELMLRYTEEAGDEYKKIMARITPYVDEYVERWVTGKGDIQKEYDDFVAELVARGIYRAIELNQEAYDSYLSRE